MHLMTAVLLAALAAVPGHFVTVDPGAGDPSPIPALDIGQFGAIPPFDPADQTRVLWATESVTQIPETMDAERTLIDHGGLAAAPEIAQERSHCQREFARVRR